MKKIFIVVTFLITAFAIHAQNNPPSHPPSSKEDRKSEKRQRINALLKLEEEGDPAFKKQSVFGIKLSTDGYGISYEKGKYKTPRKTFLYQFELNEKKHNKEVKTATGPQNLFGQSNSVVWGKINNFYQFKIGVGQQHLIGGKANKSGVAVSLLYAGGLSLGMAKPYLINVVENPSSPNSPVVRKKFTDTTGGYVIGASGFTYGWNELKIKPGLHAKFAMRFDYGRFNETVSAIEAGLNAEYYFSEVEQLLYNKPKNFFFNAYVTILFGRRK